VIPNIDNLRAVADGILKTIPNGLTRGEVTAGLYGLGFLGRWALPRLKEKGVRVVSCYDANEALKDTFYDSLPIRSAREIESSHPEFMIVSARHAVTPVSAMLSTLGIPHVSYDAWHVAEHFADFRHVHDSFLHDDRSKAVLRAVLMTMLRGDENYCSAVFEENQYFCLPRFADSDEEHFVDAGAYDGDSVERFITTRGGAFSKLYAFEPGPHQFSALQGRIERLASEWALNPKSIELINAGLGNGEYSTVAGSINGQLTNLAVVSDYAGDRISIAITGLDAFLKGRNITFIKADVEGMEMALLKGAQSTIRRDKPKIAICVYHYPTDIPEISNYLAALVPDYQFALRHHSPRLMETVLYCWTV
jgi:FkbM family methyltransferase